MNKGDIIHFEDIDKSLRSDIVIKIEVKATKLQRFIRYCMFWRSYTIVNVFKDRYGNPGFYFGKLLKSKYDRSGRLNIYYEELKYEKKGESHRAKVQIYTMGSFSYLSNTLRTIYINSRTF